MFNMNIKNKNVVLCITGGIAAYKAVSLASFLKKKGANVHCVMTKNATEFVTPLTLKTVTGNKVTKEMFDDSDFIPHISLSELADIIIVAPATANIIAKAAGGIADDMVSTILLSSKAIKMIIPAMNTNMYLNKITQKNVKILKDNDFKIMEPDEGLLACGMEGPGRFPEIEKVYDFIAKNFDTKKKIFKGKRILITAGGTIEDIDPVRFITNRSSGLMGYSFADEFISQGADVTIISGNVSDIVKNEFVNRHDNVKIVDVRSAKELKKEIEKNIKNKNIFIMTAAVADFSPEYKDKKIKKTNDKISLKLNKTDDILSSIKKNKNTIYIGFAAETENLIKNAKEKLKKKKLDIIIANLVKGPKSAIGSNKAEVVILNKWDDNEHLVEYADKKRIVKSIVEYLIKILSKYNRLGFYFNDLC